MNTFIGKMLMEMLQEIVSDIWQTFFGFVESFYLDTGWITYHPYVNTAGAAMTGIATGLLVLVASKHIFTTYILETDGDPDMDPLQYLVKTSIALALIQMQNFLFYYLLRLSSALCDEMTGFINVNIPDFSNTTDLANRLSSTGVMGATAPIIYIIFVICIIYLVIKAAFRAVELSLMKIIFPLFCCDIITPNRERWNTFVASYLVTMFGYIIQLFCFRTSMMLFLSAESVQLIIGSLALLFFSLKAPKWLEKFVYSSGAGQTVAGLGRNGVFAAMQFIRFAK